MTLLPDLSKMRIHHTRTPLATTPVDLFQRLHRDDPQAFLCESLERTGRRGRYSFLGGRPFLVLKSDADGLTLESDGRCWTPEDDVWTCLGTLLSSVNPPPVKPFPGGAMGLLSYDAVRLFERIPDANPDTVGMPDALFLFPGELIVCDHVKGIADIMTYSATDTDRRLLELADTVQTSRSKISDETGSIPAEMPPFRSNMTKQQFCEMVERAKEYILAGDIFQVVLSQRLFFETDISPFAVYQALRRTNPSPYMYFLQMDEMQVLGSSPEILATLQDCEAVIRPLAGTRPRGKSDREDRKLAADLLADEKERAEHIMLVDLARNDLGRVCKPGSVETIRLLEVERFSKVMHLVSHVKGKLASTRDALDLLASAFPAGTVSGAPKVRAMEIIDELEPHRRGVYAGAIGYIGFDGNTDMCIAIRTIVMKNRRGFVQAGAGIVADSDPAREYQETLNKARAVLQAAALAQEDP